MRFLRNLLNAVVHHPSRSVTKFFATQSFVNTTMAEFTGLQLTPSNSRETLIKDGWFAETEAMWPGQKFCIEVDEVLENGRSLFQVIIKQYYLLIVAY